MAVVVSVVRLTSPVKATVFVEFDTSSVVAVTAAKLAPALFVISSVVTPVVEPATPIVPRVPACSVRASDEPDTEAIVITPPPVDPPLFVVSIVTSLPSTSAPKSAAVPAVRIVPDRVSVDPAVVSTPPAKTAISSAASPTVIAPVFRKVTSLVTVTFSSKRRL